MPSPDMNPMAAGYGQGAPQPANPMQGVNAPQQATSMPGAIGSMVQAIYNGYNKGMQQRAGAPGGTPTAASSTAMGPPGPIMQPSPDFPMAPGPVAAMPGQTPGPVGVPQNDNAMP